MPRNFYSAPGLNVELYEDRTDEMSVVAGDLEFYRQIAQSVGGAVLELGCGNGRLVLPLARAGVSVTGLDLSDAMLDVARQRLSRESSEVQSRVTFVQADMVNFDLGATYALVLIAFRSFQMLLTPELEESCLRSARRHLERSGRLVIDVFDPLLHLLLPGPVESQGPLRTEHEGIHPNSGNRVTVDVLSRTNDTVVQLLEETWRFTEFAADGSVLRQEDEVLRLRWIYRWEMRHLLEKCGFRVVAEYSDFTKSPPAYGREQIWVCQRQ